MTNEQFDSLNFHPNMKVKLQDEKVYPVTGIDFEDKEFTIKKNEHLYAKIHCSTCEIENTIPQLKQADVSGLLPYPIEIWDGIKVDVTFKGGRLVIQKANDH